MKIDENQEKSDFNRKSLTSIPFGGPICFVNLQANLIILQRDVAPGEMVSHTWARQGPRESVFSNDCVISALPLGVLGIPRGPFSSPQSSRKGKGKPKIVDL